MRKRGNIFNGKRLKQRREKLGFTLEELAALVGTTKSYIWSLENEPSDPGAEKLFYLAVHLGVRMEWLCGVDYPADAKAATIGAQVLKLMKPYIGEKL